MSLHLWHNLSSGPQPPDVIYAVVEVPKGNRNKYEYSKRAGVIKLDRVLFSPLHYPGDYGFIPQSYFEDGDPLDILVMMNEPTFPGCVIEARPVGMFKMVDKGQPDYKILAVPATDPNFDDYKDLPDLPRHFPNEVGHFFMTYKQLEGHPVTNEGWVNAEEAKKTVMHALQLYRQNFPPESTGL
ncbi:MAG: inorganic diphosphatase [Anaerolineaceae bacterium]|nr:inorganic diphosphatase [Anaerolineaceae bacterium]